MDIGCVWNILKYALRMWNGHEKPNDVYKITHYSQLCYTLRKDAADREPSKIPD